MKKKILFTLLVLASLTSFAQARFFLGIDGGYSMDSMDSMDVKVEDVTQYDTSGGTKTILGSFTKDAYKGNGYLFNLNLGTEHHFDENNYVGFRWFLGLGYGRTNLINQIDKSISYPSNILEANLGLDLLLDVIKFGNNSSLGIFGGVEGGANGTLSNSQNTEKYSTITSMSMDIIGRVGLSLVLASHHRLEFVARIPAKYISINSSDGIKNTYHPTQFMLGYKFVF